MSKDSLTIKIPKTPFVVNAGVLGDKKGIFTITDSVTGDIFVRF